MWWAISRMQGKETPWGIETKFCVWVSIQDLVTFATCGDDRSMGLGVAMGRISSFHIDLRRRPYNTQPYNWSTSVYTVLVEPHYKQKNWITSFFKFSAPLSAKLLLLSDSRGHKNASLSHANSVAIAFKSSFICHALTFCHLRVYDFANWKSPWKEYGSRLF